MDGITISPGVVQATGTSMYGAAAAPVATTAAPAVVHKARKSHRHRQPSARATASPARDWGISITEAAGRPAAASPTPSCH
jgi:hypothetical protein